MALGVQAQTPSTATAATAGTPSNSDSSSARAQADYQAAVKACRGTIGAERTNCLRYEQTRNHASDSSSDSTANSSSGAGSMTAGGGGRGGVFAGMTGTDGEEVKQYGPGQRSSVPRWS